MTTLETLDNTTRVSDFFAIVPETRRMAFLPRHFGMRRMMTVESAVYHFAKGLLHDYSGGRWLYATTRGADPAPVLIPPEGPAVNPNGPGEGYWDFGGPSSGWSGTVSREAAGMIVCLFAFGNVWNRYSDDDPELVGIAYTNLREAVYRHPERYQIFKAID